ncbi:hypothetical protein HBA55_13635 [Pseudomaricurvus alkylphenolicus]|uniref:hypothetical protein n=1 Tax=Pseudomaricurvus alkylphenolicus TaxID=1306991 RepID=UPI00142471E6|nr:hypothetical protein [Pseudomaricurvus alkylphenolicus]NIB40638.1 hypothetical protein [Pseudomaricurvus alkylphenolicus]
MKTLMQSLAFATALIVCGHALADKLTAAHTASPEFYQVLTENEEVLVLKMVLKPGDADAMHHHNNETVYFERGGTLAITLENGKTMVVTVPDGQVMWHEAWSHQVTNVGNTEVVAVIVEAKEKR